MPSPWCHSGLIELLGYLCKTNTREPSGPKCCYFNGLEFGFILVCLHERRTRFWFDRHGHSDCCSSESLCCTGLDKPQPTSPEQAQTQLYFCFNSVYFSLFPCHLCKKCNLKNLSQVKLPLLLLGCPETAFSGACFLHLLSCSPPNMMSLDHLVLTPVLGQGAVVVGAGGAQEG